MEPSSTLTALAQHPEKILELRTEEMYSVPHGEVLQLQLEGVRSRFDALVERIPLLTKLAAGQATTRIRALDDIGPLLVPHSAYKSYPLSFLEKSQFGRLTQWLNGMTSYDLSGLDVSSCTTIDGWLDELDRKTELRVIHSTGTTGKLSFLPRSVHEMPSQALGWTRVFDTYRNERPRLSVPPRAAPTLFLQHRHGAMAFHRLLDSLQEYVYNGDPSRIVAVNPGRFSADVASMSGRMRQAQAKGELDKLQLSPAMRAVKESVIAEQQAAGQHLDTFLSEVSTRFLDQPVAVLANPPLLYKVAIAGRDRGLKRVFAPDSYIQAGGGLKGHNLPPDWQSIVLEFFGADRLSPGYGMSEVVFSSERICPQGYYHLPPWMIPFLLDPHTGAQHPRTGVGTGRLGLFDLNARTYWGGFLSGDEVTLSWGDDAACACGRIGPYLHQGIRRYSETEGGDDKISCAGVADALDKALAAILPGA